MGLSKSMQNLENALFEEEVNGYMESPSRQSNRQQIYSSGDLSEEEMCDKVKTLEIGTITPITCVSSKSAFTELSHLQQTQYKRERSGSCSSRHIEFRSEPIISLEQQQPSSSLSGISSMCYCSYATNGKQNESQEFQSKKNYFGGSQQFFGIRTGRESSSIGEHEEFRINNTYSSEYCPTTRPFTSFRTSPL